MFCGSGHSPSTTSVTTLLSGSPIYISLALRTNENQLWTLATSSYETEVDGWNTPSCIEHPSSPKRGLVDEHSSISKTYIQWIRIHDISALHVPFPSFSRQFQYVQRCWKGNNQYTNFLTHSLYGTSSHSTSQTHRGTNRARRTVLDQKGK